MGQPVGDLFFSMNSESAQYWYMHNTTICLCGGIMLFRIILYLIVSLFVCYLCLVICLPVCVRMELIFITLTQEATRCWTCAC